MANKKHNGTDKKVIIVRVICIVLAVLMFGGVIVAAVLSANAADIGSDSEGSVSADESSTVPEEHEEQEKQVFEEDDYLVRVGISFSDTTLHSHRVRTQKNAPGFELYVTTTGNELKYIWTLYNSDVSVSETGNLRRSASTDWYYYASKSNVISGGYHLQITDGFDKIADAESACADISDKAKELNVPVYPAYIGGIYYIRIGAYTSVSSAESEKSVIEAALGYGCEVVSPAASSLTVIDYETAKPLFDFDMTEQKYGLGLYCLDDNGNKDYVKTEKGYYYDGVMEFRRYKASDADGVTMILISELETYVICVVPWEIYNTWPIETMKAFSVCARTFVIANSHERAKHKAYNCDVCTTSDCQVCKGFERVNQNVINGVNMTKGEILLCDGKTTTSYYTDLGGGSMAAAHEVWNMDPVKYLVGQMTPWEDLSVSKYGAWSFTATPEELLKKVREAGYTTLNGAIEDVRINRLCENSTYVYSITITDIYGASVTVNRCRNVRGALSGLLYAANFVIEHNGKIDDGKNHTLVETVSGIYVMTADGIKSVKGEENINVMTDGGLKQQYLPQRITVKTSSSLVSQTVLISTSEIVGHSTGTNSKDFTFIGSGNGHGVGASQWGCKDLGNLGYKYDRILYTYYPYTELAYYKDYLSK
ncbi:MAG: SpoIID/LytB domain-containing protein [Clostridia bacterium]|nr:SpoIID/LytB domain-containing protein [Clostridia bacterium]